MARPGNPVHQTGTVAIAMLLLLVATGLYLVLLYRVGSRFASVARLAGDPWLGAWIRSLHRYASDLFVIAAALHALRMFAQARSWGPRAIAWGSGFMLFGAGVACAWTGFIMAWDSFGERLAREGARLLDALPVLSEPLSRIFAGDQPVPSAFFFVNLFVHLAVPLVMAAGVWLHVARVARPVLLPPRRLLWILTGGLIAIAVAVPAPLGPPADVFHLAPATPVDVTVAWWLPLSERLAPGAVWAAMLSTAFAVLLVPRVRRRPREGRLAPSVVDPRLCTGCNQCPQDCPWEAITMVPREDGRPSLLARVDPSRCVSCGICAGSCAPMGIGPPGRSGRDQLAAVRTVPDLAAAAGAPLVAIHCEQVPAAHVSALHARDASVHPVSCVGNLHTSAIEFLVRSGVPGVLVCGCPPRDCASREGPKWLHERVFTDREAELQARVDRRVRLATCAPGDLAGTMASFDAFARDLGTLDRVDRDNDGESEALCDPVSIHRAAS